MPSCGGVKPGYDYAGTEVHPPISRKYGASIRWCSGRQPPETKWRFIVRPFSPISIIVDPAISLIVFACVFLILLLTKRDLLEMGSDTLLIYQTGSVALGALSGFLGLRALYALMSYMGIKVDEKDLTGSGTKSEQSRPV
jgi:hypothetical protein